MTTEALSAQQVFDFVVTHLYTQGRKAIQDSQLFADFESCAYRSPDGAKCAVGCLLRDEEYKEEMEGSPVSDLHSEGWLPSRLVPHLALLTELQGVHDISFDVSELVRRLKSLQRRGIVYREHAYPPPPASWS